jgi:hypothetical protein
VSDNFKLAFLFLALVAWPIQAHSKSAQVDQEYLGAWGLKGCDKHPERIALRFKVSSVEWIGQHRETSLLKFEKVEKGWIHYTIDGISKFGGPPPATFRTRIDYLRKDGKPSIFVEPIYPYVVMDGPDESARFIKCVGRKRIENSL